MTKCDYIECEVKTMNDEEKAQKTCELLKIVLFGLTCPFVLPLVVENDRAEANESSH